MRNLVTIGALVFGMAAGIGAARAQSERGGGTTGMPGATGTTGAGTDTTATQKQDLSMKDRQFLMKAATGSIAEIKTAQLAVDKAQSDDVKQMAQKILDDHQKAADQLKQIAAAHDIALPTEPSTEDRQTLQKLQRASGSEFDRMFMREMQKDHEKDIAEFQRAAREVQDPQLREFATNTLPVLRQHQMMMMGHGKAGGTMKSQPSQPSPSGSPTDVERR